MAAGEHAGTIDTQPRRRALTVDATYEPNTLRVRRAPRRAASSGPPPIPRWWLILGGVAGQIAMAMIIDSAPILALAQAGALFLFGLYGVMKQDLGIIICVIAYTTGCEVLWRQARAPVFYLGATYLVIVLAGFAVVFVLKKISSDGRLALLYAALLLPAIIATIRTAGAGSREIVAFSLAGPMALAALVMFTSQVRIASWLYVRLMWVTVLSAVGPLTLAVVGLQRQVAAGSAEFSKASNFAASGGFGPVQVSSMLSLGIMASIFLLLHESNRGARVIAAIVAVVFSVQTLLTFSRGGSFSVGLAMVALIVTQLRNRRIRNTVLGMTAVAITLAYLLIFPWLNDFTGGAFQERFSDTQTGRTDLAANDTQIFGGNIVLGVGAGMTKYQRLGYDICGIRTDKCAGEASSHTEFTRMLSEHGIPGIIGIGIIALLSWRAYRREGLGRAFAIAWLTWAIAQMFYANLRIAAVPFAFSLAFLRVTPPRGPDSASHSDDDEESALPEIDSAAIDLYPPARPV